MPSKVFIVEDDAALCAELGTLLSLEGLEWQACTNLGQAAQQALAAQPDCIVMDTMLGAYDGRIIAREIREQSSTPIIMLTCLNSEFDEVMALNAGADDYVTKPYKPAVLLAHINAALRRTNQAGSRMQLNHRGVTLDIGSFTVSCQGTQAELSKNEARILALLMRNAGSVIPRQEIMCDLWESDAFIDDNTLTVNVNRLRKTLAAIGAPEDFISTKRGEGYQV